MSARQTLVKVGAGRYLTVDGVSLSATSGSLLRALKRDEAFEVELRDVPLSNCTVRVCASASSKAPSADEAAAARALEGAETLGDVAAGLVGGNLFIRVELPASGEQGTRHEPARSRAALASSSLIRVSRFPHPHPCPLAVPHLAALLQWQQLCPLPSGTRPLEPLVPGVDPFPSSPGTSVSGTTRTSGSGRSLSSTFKDNVYDFYGLHRGKHMLGEGRCTVAHLWPSSNTGFVSRVGELLGLPAGFMEEPRNYLVLPQDLHTAFDEGVVVFLPRAQLLTVRVLAQRLGRIRSPTKREAVASYHGRVLAWPNTAASPFTRLLAWHAWCVRGSQLLGHEVDYEFDAALSLTQSSAAKARVAGAVDQYSALGLLPPRRARSSRF